ncbi:MAG: ParA family protein [Caldilineaceae bacterium]|nr:ParA family protein [Caldilineaceae bacterium]
MRKIAVALSKGGVGKTTTAVNLAAGLADAGRRVLLVDLDTQDQAARMLGVDPAAGIAELVAGDLPADDALFPAREKLTLLAGGSSLAGLKRIIARKDFGGERTVSDALTPLDDRFDYVVIDTAPGWDTLAINALFYADEILTPVALEVLAVQGLLDFARNVQSIQQYHDRLTLRYVLPTFMDRRVKKSGEILAQLEESFGDRVCAPIRYNVRLSEAPGYGQTIFEYAPRSSGAEDYAALTERILYHE